MLSFSALVAFSACEKEEELTEFEFTENEHCEECEDFDAYTDIHEIAVWHYEGTENFEISTEDQWEEGNQIHTELFKTGGPSEAVSLYYHDEEEVWQMAGVGMSFGLTGSSVNLDSADWVEFPNQYLFFSNDAQIGDSWNSFNWGKEVIKKFVGYAIKEVPAGEFCCKKIEIDMGHGLMCYQWVSEIGLIAEEFYQDGAKEPVVEYFLTDIEEHECEFEEEEWEEEEEEECDCEE